MNLAPWAVAGIALVAACAFVGARWVIAARGDISRFVVAGADVVDPSSPPALHVFPGDGYDGQMYWRLAVDPTDWRNNSHVGIRFVQSYRSGRIAYPALAWVASAGQQSAVKYALVGVNVALFAAAAYVAALLARRRGRAPIWGLFIVSATGLIAGLSRDLTEVLMVTTLLLGGWCISRKRFGGAAAAWSVAALTHEQALYVIAAHLVWLALSVRRRRRVTGSELAVGLVPGAVYVIWQTIVRQQVHQWPVMTSRQSATGAPFIGLIRTVNDWAHGAMTRQEILAIPQIIVAVALAVMAYRRRRDLDVEWHWVLWALGVAIAASLSLSRLVWIGPLELRQAILVPTLSALAITMSSRPISSRVAACVGVLWVVTAGLRVFAI